MRRVKTMVLLVLAAAAVLASAAGRRDRARADTPVRSYVGDWVYYAWETPSPGTKWGDAEVHKTASIPRFGARVDCHAFRAVDCSGTIHGGAADTGTSGAGLVVPNPVAGNRYSWTASCDVSSEFRAEVDCGDLGYTAGHAVGGVEMQVYGDLKWRIERTVEASCFEGGSWVLGFPPHYVPPASGSQIAYIKPVDTEPIVAHANSTGADHHVQVRYRGRISGTVMAHCQTGLDKRAVNSRVSLDACAHLVLTGYTKRPSPPDVPPESPVLRARLSIVSGSTGVFPYGLLSKEDAEAAATGEEEPAEDAADGETTGEEPDPSAGGDTRPEDVPPPPSPDGGLHDPKDFEVELW
jgi:hypothetical protein